jgi:hypothetical protein
MLFIDTAKRGWKRAVAFDFNVVCLLSRKDNDLGNVSRPESTALKWQHEAFWKKGMRPFVIKSESPAAETCFCAVALCANMRWWPPLLSALIHTKASFATDII